MQILAGVDALHLETREAGVAVAPVLRERVDLHPYAGTEFFQEEHGGLAVEIALNQQTVAVHLGGSVVNAALGEGGFEILGKPVLVANRLRDVADDDAGPGEHADHGAHLAGENAAGALVPVVESVSHEPVARFRLTLPDGNADAVVTHA